MATVQSPSDQRMVLYQVSWDTYEHLLKNYENASSPRFTYDRGTLEIMSPLPKHERLAWAAERLIEAVLALLGLEYDKKLQIPLLQGSEYVEAGASRALPVVRAGEATRLLAESNGLGRAAWLERLRQWVDTKRG